MLLKFIDDPDMPTLKLLFLMFTLDIIYIHHSLSFTIRTAKAAAKGGVYTAQQVAQLVACNLLRNIASTNST